MEQLNFIDWERPQRQPIKGLIIVFVKTLWQVLKTVWPFVLLMIFNAKPGRSERYALIAAALSIFAIVGSIIQFIYFRFYILNGELIIKKGWLKKETHTIPLHRIQTVNIEESFLHSALGIVKVGIDTAGSGITEASIDALTKPMAEALKAQLFENKEVVINADQINTPAFTPIIKLSGKDLLKLSLSANHIEAFFILLSFVIGMYDNIKDINLPFLPDEATILASKSLPVFAFLTVSVLFITIIISSARIIFKYYDFTLAHRATDYFIRSGLTNVKERMVGFEKIQFINWKANWIRKKLGLFMMEYAVAGTEEMKAKMRVHVPITDSENIPLLMEHYYPASSQMEVSTVSIHPSYVVRRFLFAGLMPAVIAMAITWQWWGLYSLFFLVFSFYIGVSASLYKKKFQLSTSHEALLINDSVWGIGKLLLKWYKIQNVSMNQSLHQRSKNLATIVLDTAAGPVKIPYIDIAAAQQIMNYSLYQIEHKNKKWM